LHHIICSSWRPYDMRPMGCRNTGTAEILREVPTRSNDGHSGDDVWRKDEVVLPLLHLISSGTAFPGHNPCMIRRLSRLLLCPALPNTTLGGCSLRCTLRDNLDSGFSSHTSCKIEKYILLNINGAYMESAFKGIFS
jgi:hypothetical protein